MRSFSFVLSLRLAFVLSFVAACAREHSHDTVEAKPYVVELRDDVPIESFIDEHDLEPAMPLPIIHGFAADLRPATVEALRADDRVERLTEDRATKALGD